MKKDNLYTYSQLASMSVGRMVANHYGLDDKLNCRFYVLGLHDNYLIESGVDKFILRIYRNNWRTEEEINFELELIAYLNSKTRLVAELLPTVNGKWSFTISSPEGNRFAALFRYAAGHAPEAAMTENEAGMLARTVATVHQLSDAFRSTYTRKILDLNYLLDDSISTIIPYLDKHGIAYLQELQERLYLVMPKLEHGPEIFGICTGDVNPSNFHINENQSVTLFDFDQCGYGYRAFEIGKFFSSVRNHKDKLKISRAFLKGYQEIRQLGQAELDAIPCFEIISVIWVMSIQALNADRIGYKYLEKLYWDRRLTNLENLVLACPDKAIRPIRKFQ